MRHLVGGRAAGAEDNVLYRGSCTQWDVEKFTIK
jgi:hypothetical protein